MTTPNNGGRKQPETLVSVVTTDLSAIANGTLPYKGETKEQKQRTKGLFAAKRGFKKGEDPISMILGNNESPDRREKGLPHSFFCTQKHKQKKVGDGNSTICTAIDMKEVDSKSYMNSYKLTHQTCCVKSEKCIFLMDKYSGCKDWSSVPCKFVWYCNMCAILRREPKHEDVIITSMCSFCKDTRQEKEDSNMEKDCVSSKRSRPRRRGNK